MRRSSTSTTPPATSPAPADVIRVNIRIDVADLVRQIEEMMISPVSGRLVPPSEKHCTHCTRAGLAGGVIGWGIPCLDHECPCRPDHLGECSCHGNFREWCDAREIWAWLNGLTNGATPIILARVTS